MEIGSNTRYGDGQPSTSWLFFPYLINNRVQGTYTKIYLQFPEKFWFDTEVPGITNSHLSIIGRSDVKIRQFALYADHERGWYPVWQSLDMNGFFPGSGILFVTVTARFLYLFLSARLLTTDPSY